MPELVNEYKTQHCLARVFLAYWSSNQYLSKESDGMCRRHLGGILIGFALLAQLLVPAAALRIHAQANDPFSSVLLCTPDVAPGADHSVPGGIPPHHDHCLLCQIAIAGSLLDARAVCIAAPYSNARPVSWTVQADRLLFFGRDRHRPPRGPPSLI